jgi:hypothetical protein
MSTFNGDSYTDLKNLNIKGGASGHGLIRWSPAGLYGQNGGLWASNPFSTTDYGLYINSSGYLVFSSQGTSTILGAAGSGGTLYTWDQIQAGDQALDVGGTNSLTITSTGTGSNNVLTVSETAAGSGAMIQVSNTSGSGPGINFTSGNGVTYDVLGTSSTWSASITGALTGISLTSSGTTLTLAATGSNAVIVGTGSNTVTIAKPASFSSTIATSSSITSTNSTVILTSNSNTVAPLIITDNTVTSYGGSASEGLAVIRSTSITSGTLLRLQAAEGTITGYYLNAYDSVGAASVFSIRAKGATVIAGNAYATAALTLTAGDIVVTAGKINHTAAGATSTNGYTGTFNGLTTGVGMSLVHTTSAIADGGSLLRLASSGIDTGGATNGALFDFKSTAQLAGTVGRIDSIATTGTVLSIISTGIMTTTGNLLTLTANSATTAAGLLRVNCNGITDGMGVVIASSATASTATGRMFLVNHSGATSTSGILSEFLTAATDETIAVQITTAAMVNGIALNIIGTTGMTTGSLIRVATATAGAVSGSGIVSITGTGAHTGSVGLLDVRSTGTTAGAIVSIACSTASQTATSLLSVVQSGATITAFTGSVASFTGAGTTGSGSTILVTSVNTTAGDGVKLVSNALTVGAGTALNISHTTSVLGAGTSLVRISSTGVDTGVTTGVLLDLSTTSCAGSTQVLLTDSSADTAARVGIYSKITNAAAVLAIPLKTSNVAVVNSKFTKHIVMTDGTKTTTIWLSQDATDPNGTLTGVAGDLCLNGPSNKPYYCTTSGTVWATVV